MHISTWVGKCKKLFSCLGELKFGLHVFQYCDCHIYKRNRDLNPDFLPKNLIFHQFTLIQKIDGCKEKEKFEYEESR